jgi:DNA-binding CsgD family transcriptional regulator
VAASVVGRDAELAMVGDVLAASADGLQVLVIEGEPGIGKTTVWRSGVDQAEALGHRILLCRAAQAETRMSFAGLIDLLGDVEPDYFSKLPPPQRLAVDRAMLRATAGEHSPPQAIGAGVVGVLSALADHGPVLIALDDVQWLDKPTVTVLAFALRRLDGFRVTVLATARVGDPHGWSESFGSVAVERVRRLSLGPLSLGALHEVLRPRLGRALTRPLLGSIQTASGGNPFYALEIARAIEEAGGSTGTLPVLEDTSQLVSRRLRRLQPRTRDELLRASALMQPTLGILDEDCLQPAIDAGIARVYDDGRVEFTHPLFAGAVYAAATRSQRQQVHRELASANVEIEEQARHLSLASDGPDATIADLLDQASEHALRRGAPEVAADLSEQAARRTSDDAPTVRWERLLRAGRYRLKAGDPTGARALGEEVSNEAPDGPIRAKALSLRAEERVMEGPAATIELLEEAIAVVGDDVALETELETSLGFMLLALFQLNATEQHTARAADLAERAGDRSLQSQAIALRELAGLLLGKGVDGAALDRALALEDLDHEVPFQRRPSLLVALVLEYTGELARAKALMDALRERLVARGDEGDLAHLFVHRGAMAWLAGDTEAAEEYAEASLRMAALTGQDLMSAFALSLRAMVRAWRGDLRRAREDALDAIERSERLGWVTGVNQSRWALAIIALSEEDPAAAVTWLDPVVAQVEAIGVYEWVIAMSIPDAIEALIATGDIARAVRLTDSLENLGRTHDRPWALALSGRSRALLSAADGDLEEAQAHAQQALIHHQRLQMPLELGRTMLVLGQLQRRRGERSAARETLSRAESTFDRLGASIWVDKARAEARRIGIRRAPTELTANEQMVAELAGGGLTNREIAARMFMSRRTVEANLSRAYAKLGVRSRTELAGRMTKRESASPT